MNDHAYTDSQSWDLQSLYPGGCAGPTMRQRVDQTRSELTELLKRFQELTTSELSEALGSLPQALLDLERWNDQLHDIGSFGHCAASADTEDADARELLGICADLESLINRIGVLLRSRLASLPPEHFERLVAVPRLEHMRFFLNEQRRRSEIMMEAELETLQEELAPDGLHGWSRLYDEVSGRLRVRIDRGQGDQSLSVEQARNLLASTDGPFRQSVAEAIHVTWDSQKEIFAAILNHINGYRHVIYRRRGIDELEVPLRLNRIGRETLQTLMEVIADFRPTMARYLEAKAAMLGMDRLSWYDLGVPLGSMTAKIPYDQAQRFIVQHFDQFSPELGEFARTAFRNRWIEAEDRAGKRHGGFCAGFPLARQSRIFMTYGQTMNSVLTLAHELGHAYHGWVLKDLPGRQREYPAALAETASTFAESIVREAAFAQAADDQARLSMLDRKLTDAVSHTMNLPARFHFERALFRERANGEVSSRRLTELVIEAFDQAFDGAVDRHEQLFWASKLHFHLTGLPFYNFPYIVGYLFSLGLFARAQREGSAFAEAYRQTLRLTGHHSVEEVALEALGVDLRRPDFWRSALDLVARDVEAFVAIA
ncbi:MAG: M3 family oligoendopeptidase [Bradymonadales bacterium]|nr:M3 family oligoendopeptidase [Bradymonadales bacterium]